MHADAARLSRRASVMTASSQTSNGIVVNDRDRRTRGISGCRGDLARFERDATLRLVVAATAARAPASGRCEFRSAEH